MQLSYTFCSWLLCPIPADQPYNSFRSWHQTLVNKSWFYTCHFQSINFRLFTDQANKNAACYILCRRTSRRFEWPELHRPSSLCR